MVNDFVAINCISSEYCAPLLCSECLGWGACATSSVGNEEMMGVWELTGWITDWLARW